MVSPIPKSVMQIWDEWNLRVFIILSFSLQTFLILCAPFRKRTSKLWIVFPIWSVYLLSDWTASFAIGLISSSPADDTNRGGPRYPGDINGDLLAFWAPFLLLHLGGPDTIIAIAMEDSALWPRQLVGFVFQVLAGIYIFLKSFPQSKLWIPSLLLSLTGFIKYAERTWALYLASLDGLKGTLIKKPEPGQNYAKFMEEFSTILEVNIPSRIEFVETEAHYTESTSSVAFTIEEGWLEDDLAVVRCAHHFFEISKRLIIGLVFSFDERNESREFFLNRTSVEAFKLISVELNFLYEAFYTKVAVVHSKIGYFNRAVSFSVVCVALVSFCKLEKHDFHKFDVGITYTLVYGAIGLDLIAVVMIIFSDWTAVKVALNKFWLHSCIATLLSKYLHLKRSSWSTIKPSCLERTRKILFGRWSESVSTFNLIDYSFKEHQILTSQTVVGCCRRFFCLKIINFFGLNNIRNQIKHMSSKPLTRELWKFIFQELKNKSIIAEDPQTGKTMCSARGDWSLQNTDLDSTSQRTILNFVVEVNYDQSILLWHIATELCYNTDEGNDDADNQRFREYSKTLSDYMLYLLVMQPAMMSSVAGIGQVELWDTCEEAKTFFTTSEGLKPGVEQQVCKRILQVNTDIKPVAVKGGKSKSVFFDACILAKELKKLERNKWKLMGQVWVEMLSYAASHSRANSHADLLSKGGELVTFVWLLMARFGIAEQFQVKEDRSKVKLIVGK